MSIRDGPESGTPAGCPGPGAACRTVCPKCNGEGMIYDQAALIAYYPD